MKCGIIFMTVLLGNILASGEEYRLDQGAVTGFLPRFRNVRATMLFGSQRDMACFDRQDFGKVDGVNLWCKY